MNLFCNSKAISRNYTIKLRIHPKDEKVKVLHFNRYVKKHRYIYIYIYATCWVYIQAHSFENQYNMEEKFLPKRVIQACFTTISLPILEKKKSIKLKTSWHQYTSSLILKTHTHTPTHPITTSRLYKQRKIKLKFKDNQKITW